MTYRIRRLGPIRFGGFARDDLVGLAGLHLRSGAKQRHKAQLFTMYVEAAHRRTGMSRLLVDAGFVVYGVERRSFWSTAPSKTRN
jgi:hypothetical protein